MHIRNRLLGAACFLATCLSVVAVVTLLSSDEADRASASTPSTPRVASVPMADRSTGFTKNQTPPGATQPWADEIDDAPAAGPERPERVAELTHRSAEPERSAQRAEHATEHAAEQADPASARLPRLATRSISSDLDVVTEGSLALVVELAPTGVRVVEVVKKDVPFRVLNARGGDYQYEVEDAAGTVLHQGQFEVAALCPLQGTEHTADHLLGHIVLGHQASILIRIPDAANAHAIVFRRQLPDFDATPLFLGRVDL